MSFTYLVSNDGSSSLFGPETPRHNGTGSSPGLKDISFDAAPGTLTVLCGASGCGKSSALRLVNGLIPHFHRGSLSGDVTVAGVNVPHTELSEAGHTSATVFQNPRTQFFTTDVTSELAFRNENYGVPRSEIAERTREAAARVGVSDLLGRPLRELSGGQQQRVACAQALAGGVKVLLFDEPTANLDVGAIEQFGDILRQLKADGYTLIVAEHRLYFLRDLADAVLYVDGGSITRRWTGREFAKLPDSEVSALGLRRSTRSPLLPALQDALTSGPASSGSSGVMTSVRSVVPGPHGDVDRGSSDAGLVLENVRFGYRGRPVLDIPRLVLRAGEVTAVIGANGAGKSTLLRLISGLEHPRRGGRITLDGRAVNHRARLAGSAVVLQDVNRQLFSGSVRDEVLLGGSRRKAGGTAAARATEDADRLLERFGLAGVADRHPMSLSGGQKQRLVIASAVARHPRIALFDEPTSGVDRRHLVTIGAELKALAEEGTVVIVVSHDPELLAECADRVVTLQPLTAC